MVTETGAKGLSGEREEDAQRTALWDDRGRLTQEEEYRCQSAAEARLRT